MTNNKFKWIKKLNAKLPVSVKVVFLTCTKDISLTRAQLILGGFVVFITFYLFSVITCIYTPFKVFLPGYMDISTKAEVIQNNFDMDSLYIKSGKVDNYLENLRRILASESVQKFEEDYSIPSDSLIFISAQSLPDRSQLELDFVRSFEEEEKYNLSELITHNAAEGLSFVRPLKGVIRRETENVTATGNSLNILCARNSLVSNPLEGTIISAEYSVNNKHIVVVLHKNNFISIFKNIHSLRKETNSKILTGEIIGTMSDRELDDSQPLLVYELWHNGIMVNPEEYINF